MVVHYSHQYLVHSIAIDLVSRRVPHSGYFGSHLPHLVQGTEKLETNPEGGSILIGLVHGQLCASLMATYD